MFVFQVSGPSDSEKTDIHAGNTNAADPSENLQDDEEYAEDDSNNNPDDQDGDNDDSINQSSDMPNENVTDGRAATPSHMEDAPNASANSPRHHMKNIPSDEEFYSGAGGGAAASGSNRYSMGRYMPEGGNRSMMPGNDNMSENSSQPPIQMTRSKSRIDMGGASSRYQNLSYWKARRMIFYRNGDPFFPGLEYRFKPGRDVSSLETLLDKISPKMDLPRGARYVFSMDGDRKYTLDELEDGASYVVSSLKVFKVSNTLASTNL